MSLCFSLLLVLCFNVVLLPFLVPLSTSLLV